MKIFFVSSSFIALEVFKEILRHYEVVGVLTLPDKPKGRGQKLSQNVIKVEAIAKDIKVFDPLILDNNTLNSIRDLNPDLMLVFSYGKIFKKEFLDIFRMGCINVHPSLLPKYRGVSPIQSAILNGDCVSGITIQSMALEMDSGNILVQKKFKIRSYDTSYDISKLVSSLSPSLVLEALEKISKGFLGIPQKSSEATFCSFLKKELGFIDFNLSSFEIKNRINACNPWPLVRAKLDYSDIIFHRADFWEIDLYKERKVGEIVDFDPERGLFVNTGKGILFLLEVQRPGRRVLDFKSFYNGSRQLIGRVFSSVGGIY
ncbi:MULTISPECIES: methionyl-tRNA formyltransferase [Borreliella]|uniref:Methionyl-tRNA formyltransferase n=2 Tax=Borrelia garinii subsp. bavariensis (strain ATCC BAA-2496 / DSM 23469 / PBi) TaxID=290434 RepID=FMT_BORGP|nr:MULTISPECIES: methionyl-tRNA formyltransferase [Borreliella]Q662V0.1 RecName: Full=Methionyl-tRNA formyltransferase [Borreliella bavariensis PBi]AAU06921.1 methionyl-tRNA formyltransferase [Borreliella bavariensis PBi]AZA27036.1 methionyl-tRNA formyltransferase [Borreliella bavariensis PBi]WLN23752.1 methionyl-tRNA formyltransferase [Borreliella bavariensis]